MGRLTVRVNNNNGGGAEERGMKKGPWTAAEDAKLSEYVRKHGEGNWNAVQQNMGLARCGKSCRLRWANHLRPNLKKGAFSPEEETLIIQLHANFGNKWARMASLLPGRTDNEIKNFWNTRMKRRQRAGLPLYPSEVLQSVQTPQPQSYHNSSSFSSLDNQTHHNITNNNIINNNPMNHEPTNNYNPYGFSSLPIITNPQLISHHHHDHLMPFNNLSTQTNNIKPYPFQYYTTTTNSTRAALGPLISSIMLAGPPEIPSSQRLPATSDRPAVSAGDSNDPFYERFKRNGLLGDLVVNGERSNNATMMSSLEEEKWKSVAVEEEEEHDEYGVVRSKLNFDNDRKTTENLIGSCEQSSIGIEQSKGRPIDVTSMDEDLMSLLNNFQSSVMSDPSEWYPSRPDLTTRANARLGAGGFDSSSAGKCDRIFSSCYWNNMPGIH